MRQSKSKQAMHISSNGSELTVLREKRRLANVDRRNPFVLIRTTLRRAKRETRQCTCNSQCRNTHESEPIPNFKQTLHRNRITTHLRVRDEEIAAARQMRAHIHRCCCKTFEKTRVLGVPQKTGTAPDSRNKMQKDTRFVTYPV